MRYTLPGVSARTKAPRHAVSVPANTTKPSHGSKRRINNGTSISISSRAIRCFEI